MAFLDALARLVTTTLRLVLWLAAALLGLVLVSLGLAALLLWVLIQRLRGRPSPVFMSGRFQDLGRFRAAFGRNGFDASVFQRRRPEQPAETPSALTRRGAPGAVQDVQARDLPTDKS